MNSKREITPLPDPNQNFWQMASIQSSAFGIPVLTFGADMGRQHGPLLSIVAICIGNLILWLIGLAIVAMTIRDKKNAIENLTAYVGKYGCWLGGFALSLAFLFWYPIQIRAAASAIKTILEPYMNLSDTFPIRIGTFFGLAMALITMGGIKLIRRITVISFPLIMLFLIYAVLKNDSPITFKGSLKDVSSTFFSSAFFSATLASISVTLAGVVNLPTFFRHRRSEVHAYLALSIFVFFTALIECLAVFLLNSQNGLFFTKYLNYNAFNAALLVLFVLIMMICVNMTNIYFASAVWEAIFPWASRSKEFAIIGMGGTLMFVFFQAQVLMTYLETLFTNFIGILGIVIIICYAIKRIVEHREREWELFISTICWLIGCFVTVLFQDIQLNESSKAFFYGTGVSFLIFVVILFVEESFWAFKKIAFKRQTKLRSP